MRYTNMPNIITQLQRKTTTINRLSTHLRTL